MKAYTPLYMGLVWASLASALPPPSTQEDTPPGQMQHPPLPTGDILPPGATHPPLDNIESPWHAPTREGLAPLTPALEARVQKLGKEIRCPMCQGLSVADSGSSSARAQMDKIRELVSQGKDDAEIRDFFVSRYGEWALLQPVKSGLNLLLYAAPFALLAVGLGVLSWRRRKVGPEGEGTTTGEAVEAGGAVGKEGIEASGEAPTPEDSRLIRVLQHMDMPPQPPPLQRGEKAAALYARYESLLGQLREQREEQHLLSAEEADKEKAQLLQEASACLEKLEKTAPASGYTPPPPSSNTPLRKRLLLLSLGGILLGCFSTLVLLKLSRQAEVPPPPPHANVEDTELMTAFVYFRDNPGDLDGAAHFTKLLIQRGQWDDATMLVMAASRVDPLHVPFRIYRCLLEGVSSNESNITRARAEELAKLFATYDGAYEAAYWAAALYSKLGDKPHALAMLQAFKSHAPPEELPLQLEQLIAEQQP
ncbi:MAG: cytochrome c-type biogenesis protein CcmH [Cystobacterineae bacterium]|nr:cytochrome c-type biogenesis protein CcmH [Cystobacterineae bacterium]